MSLILNRVDVWAAEIDDEPGAVGRTLRGVAERGADLEFVVARRLADKSGKGVVYLGPLKGEEQTGPAGEAGLRRASELSLLKIEGPNEPGMSGKVTGAIPDAGVNLNSLTGTVYGPRFLLYAGFDNAQDLKKAETALKALAARR